MWADVTSCVAGLIPAVVLRFTALGSMRPRPALKSQESEFIFTL